MIQIVRTISEVNLNIACFKTVANYEKRRPFLAFFGLELNVRLDLNGHVWFRVYKLGNRYPVFFG